MPGQPGVVIIARHGARLDQSDREWQTKSDRPWDTPLSYGGWIQSQSLGARIAAELHALDTHDRLDDPSTEALRPRKRRRLVIHSSPYLRCIQTSIALAAGLKYPQETIKTRPVSSSHNTRSSLSKPPLSADDPFSPTRPETKPTKSQLEDAAIEEQPPLKIDAFLGEWLSSGYFEKSKPPPSSDVLIKSAKEFLQLPPEEIKGADLTQPSIQDISEMEWDDQDNDIALLPPLELTGLRAMAVLGHALPKRSRTLSFGKDPSNGVDPRHHRRVRSSTYSPPVPTYAIAPQDAIPPGYVAHARDACIKPDLNWDSQQPPLEWGDGGQYEEEWVTMHRRFRNGLQQMMAYYSLQAMEQEVNGTTIDKGNEAEEEEIVLILVTHQAGCNALIRLVTGAPALHDVGTASLTMAVRKPESLSRKTSNSSQQSPTRQRRGSLDIGLSDEFDMRIIASTEHLRPGSNPLGLNSPRLGYSPAFASRRAVGAESLEGFSIGDPLTRRANSYHPLGRSSSLRSYATDSSPRITPVSGTGLWGVKGRNNSIGSESVDPKSGPVTPKSGTILEDDETQASETTESPISTGSVSSWKPPSNTLPVRSASQKMPASTGLWGSGGNSNMDGNGLWSAGNVGTRSPGQRRWTSSSGGR